MSKALLDAICLQVLDGEPPSTVQFPPLFVLRQICPGLKLLLLSELVIVVAKRSVKSALAVIPDHNLFPAPARSDHDVPPSVDSQISP